MQRALFWVKPQPEERFSSMENSLKNRMYRARKRGLDLMEGGYLELMHGT